MTAKEKEAPQKDSDEQAEACEEMSEQTEEAEHEGAEGTADKRQPREVLEELRRKAEERDAIFEKLQHTTADFVNYQKRMRKEREALRQFAVQELVAALVPCLENFDHAIASAESSPDQGFLEGVKLVEQEFVRVLQNFGVERMHSQGAKFDPNLHEAVIQEEDDSVPHETILDELRAGYTLNGRVIRAAQVKVSRHPNPEGQS